MTEEHAMARAYPVRLEIDYPEEGLSRVTTAFRLVLLIPVAVISTLLTSSAAEWADDVDPWLEITAFTFSTSGFVVVPLLLAILFRGKYPCWWFDWNLELGRFLTRVTAYAALLRDEYPSLDEAQAVRLEIDYPDAGRDLSRWLPLVKWFLAIPHYVVLTFLGVASVVLVAVAWFAILFTGRYPRGIFGFLVGACRWVLRVNAYMFLLVTDRYPPFSLDP